MKELLMLFELRKYVNKEMTYTDPDAFEYYDESSIGQARYDGAKAEYNKWAFLVNEINKQIIQCRNKLNNG